MAREARLNALILDTLNGMAARTPLNDVTNVPWADVTPPRRSRLSQHAVPEGTPVLRTLVLPPEAAVPPPSPSSHALAGTSTDFPASPPPELRAGLPLSDIFPDLPPCPEFATRVLFPSLLLDSPLSATPSAPFPNRRRARIYDPQSPTSAPSNQRQRRLSPTTSASSMSPRSQSPPPWSITPGALEDCPAETEGTRFTAWTLLYCGPTAGLHPWNPPDAAVDITSQARIFHCRLTHRGKLPIQLQHDVSYPRLPLPPYCRCSDPTVLRSNRPRPPLPPCRIDFS